MLNVASEIRKELKNKGINSKMVSVTTKNGGYSESIHVKIKDLKVNIEELKALVENYKSVDYCEASGEVLLGGNTYTFVEFDREAIKKEVENMMPEIEKIWNNNQILPENLGETILENNSHRIVYFRKTSCDWGFIEVINKASRNYPSFRDFTKYSAYNLNSFAEGLVIMMNQYNFNIEKSAISQPA